MASLADEIRQLDSVSLNCYKQKVGLSGYFHKRAPPRSADNPRATVST